MKKLKKLIANIRKSNNMEQLKELEHIRVKLSKRYLKQETKKLLKVISFICAKEVKENVRIFLESEV